MPEVEPGLKKIEIIKKAKGQLVNLTGFKEPTAVGFKKANKGWIVTVETVERKSTPDAMDIIGTYKVHVDTEGNLVSYKKMAMRKRIDTEEFVKEEGE